MTKSAGLHTRLAMTDGIGDAQKSPAPAGHTGMSANSFSTQDVFGPSVGTRTSTGSIPAAPAFANATQPLKPVAISNPRVVVKGHGRDQKKMLALAVVLALVLAAALLWGNGFFNPAVEQETTANTKAAPAGSTLKWSPPPPMPEFSRDPMSFASSSAVSSSRFTLSGIIWNQNQAAALIDGKAYRVGDQLMGMTIVSIGTDYIEYNGPEGLQRQYLPGTGQQRTGMINRN